MSDVLKVIAMNALKHLRGIRECLLGSNGVDILNAIAGVGKETVAIGVALELIEHAGDVCRQQVALLLLQLLFGCVGKGANKAHGLAAAVALDDAPTQLHPFIVAVAAAQAVCAFKKIRLAPQVQREGI